MSIDDLLRLEALTGRRLTRRDLLRATGKGGAGLAAAAFLAACAGLGAESSPTAAAATPTGLPPLALELSIAQWPLYINPGNKGADSPTIVAFEQETGIDVTYRENINDNAAFFGKLVPQMGADQDPGYDLITLSDWVVVKMDRLGWLAPIDHTALPTVTANIGAAFADPAYDPGNAHSVPWQGGVTGIAYDPTMTGREITSFDDLWDRALRGARGDADRDGRHHEPDAADRSGVDPRRDARRRAPRAGEASSSSATPGSSGGTTGRATRTSWPWETCGRRWRGPAMSSAPVPRANPDLEFVVPEEGGILWATPMEIPSAAQHPPTRTVPRLRSTGRRSRSGDHRVGPAT